MTAAALIDWAAQTGLMVSLLIVIVLILRRPVARYIGAGAAYALWLLPLARLLMPQMTMPFIRQPVLEPTIFSVAAIPNVEMLPTDETASELSIMDRTDTTALFNGPRLVISDGSILPETGPFFTNNVDVALTVVAIWIGLAIAWLAFQLMKQHNFMRAMKAEAILAPKSLDGPIAAAMEFAGLRNRPDIRLSNHVQGPMVTGIAFPLILLPSDFEIRFKPEQQSFALVHEMAHIKRGDLWAALVTLIFRAIFWLNPLVHYAAHKMRADQEAACDASVIAKTGGPCAVHSYAETLIHAAKFAGRHKYNAPFGLALSDWQSHKEKDDDKMA